MRYSGTSRLPGADAVFWEAARECLGAKGMLSVVLPCHRLDDVIVANVKHIAETFRNRLPFEIVAVDDGSSDNTLAQLRTVKSECPELVVVPLSPNQGKGNALRAGFQHTRGTHVLFLDADLDLRPYQAAWFFERMRETGADIVIGAKRHPRSELAYPLTRRVISVVYYFMVRMMFGLPIRDTQTGIKLFRRCALEAVLPRMLVKRFAFDLELLVIARQLGFMITEAPVKLQFQGPIGCLTPMTVRNVAVDTLAIFYRSRILRYYQTLTVIPPPETPPLVSVVIACPSVSSCLDECLQGLAFQTYRRFEVLILPDVASGRQWPDGIREIPTGCKRPAEKRNRGITEAGGEIVAFLDDDAVPVSGWLDEAVRYFGDRDVAAVGGPGVTPENDSFRASLSGRVFANPLVSGQARLRYVPTRVCKVDDLPSCNLIVRKAVLDQIGGFLTDYWPGEDTVLCMEIVRRGRVIYYDPRVLVYHHRRELFGPHLRQVGRYALHRGFFARRFPATSLRIAYMLPSLFLLGLLAGALAAAALPVLRVWYFAGVLLYVALTGLSCISLETLLSSGKIPFTAWILTWMGVVATHMVYGFRFMVGLAARRMPEDVRAFDHVSEVES